MGSLYHEKQVSLLCGVHALNTLLQGPYFTAHDLAAIAQEFDERERALMREAGVDSVDFLRYMAVRVGSLPAARVRGRIEDELDLSCTRRRWSLYPSRRCFPSHLLRRWVPTKTFSYEGGSYFSRSRHHFLVDRLPTVCLGLCLFVNLPVRQSVSVSLVSAGHL